MKSNGEILRTFKRGQWQVDIMALPDDDIDLSLDETGDIARGLESGELVAFCARVRVRLNGVVVGNDYLGGCIYKSGREFAFNHLGLAGYRRQHQASENVTAAKEGRDPCKVYVGAYVTGMVHEAIEDARATVRGVQSVKVRAA